MKRVDIVSHRLLLQAQDGMRTVSHIGIYEGSVRRGQKCIIVLRDFLAKQLRFVALGYHYETVAAFTHNVYASRLQIEHVRTGTWALLALKGYGIPSPRSRPAPPAATSRR